MSAHEQNENSEARKQELSKAHAFEIKKRDAAMEEFFKCYEILDSENLTWRNPKKPLTFQEETFSAQVVYKVRHKQSQHICDYCRNRVPRNCTGIAQIHKHSFNFQVRFYCRNCILKRSKTYYGKDQNKKIEQFPCPETNICQVQHMTVNV